MTIVLVLLWLYRSGTNLRLRFSLLAAWMLMSVLILTHGDSKYLLLVLGATPMALTAVARVPQIHMNWRTRQTGQLSFITFFLQFLGCVARVLTTLQLLGRDVLSLISYSVPAVLDLIIVLQIVAYARPQPVRPKPRLVPLEKVA